MLAFGELLTISDLTGSSPVKVAFGQSVQFFAIIFLSFAAISFISSCFSKFFRRNAKAKTTPEPEQIARPQPAPPPPAKKRKYTERDFMPAALRAELEAQEEARLPEAPPPPPSDKNNSDTTEFLVK